MSLKMLTSHPLIGSPGPVPQTHKCYLEAGETQGLGDGQGHEFQSSTARVPVKFTQII